MSTINLVSRLRRRARKRGFSHVSTTLEAAAIMGWFALSVIAEKKLDDAVTARRASESSAEVSVHSSAAAATSRIVQAPVGEARPSTHALIAKQDKLGPSNDAMPSLGAVSIDPANAFPHQRAPIQSAQVQAMTNGAFSVTRSMAAADPLPAAITPQIAPLRTTLWTEHVMGY